MNFFVTETCVTEVCGIKFVIKRFHQKPNLISWVTSSPVIGKIKPVQTGRKCTNVGMVVIIIIRHQ